MFSSHGAHAAASRRGGAQRHRGARLHKTLRAGVWLQNNDPQICGLEPSKETWLVGLWLAWLGFCFLAGFGWLLASSWLSGWFGLASGWLSGWFGLAPGWLVLAWLLAGFLAGLAWLLAGLVGWLVFWLGSWLAFWLAWLLAGSGWFGLAPGWLSGWFSLTSGCLAWLLAGFLAGLAWLFFPLFLKARSCWAFCSLSRGHYAATRPRAVLF